MGSAAGIDYSSTRAARRGRALKAEKLAAAAAAAGISTCELRRSHPSCAELRLHVLKAAAVSRASAETWAAVMAGLDDRLSAAGPRRCDRCGAPVLVAVGQRSPVLWLDPLPHPDGDVTLQRLQPDSGEPPLATAANHDVNPRWRRHTAVCPASVAVSRRLPRSRRCLICQHALAWWITDPSYVTHPACEPLDRPTSPHLGRTAL